MLTVPVSKFCDLKSSVALRWSSGFRENPCFSRCGNRRLPLAVAAEHMHAL